MTKIQKRKFINDLVDCVRSGILDKIDQMPEAWDGIELRQYIADTFAMQCRSLSFRLPMSNADRMRKRDYENEVLVRNL